MSPLHVCLYSNMQQDALASVEDGSDAVYFSRGFIWRTVHTSFPCYLCCNLLVTLVKFLQLYRIQNFTRKEEFSHFHMNLIQNSAFPFTQKNPLAPTFLCRQHSHHLNNFIPECAQSLFLCSPHQNHVTFSSHTGACFT